MTVTTKMKIAIVLAGVFLLVFSENLLACHQLVPFEGGGLKGHSSAKTRGYGGMTLGTTASTTDSTATTTNCDWRTTKIEKFFNDSFQQIAEESAQGSGQHLEALASLSGCSAEQYTTFETAMNRNHSYVFAELDYDGSINNFFNVLNTDQDLLQCWGQS